MVQTYNSSWNRKKFNRKISDSFPTKNNKFGNSFQCFSPNCASNMEWIFVHCLAFSVKRHPWLLSQHLLPPPFPLWHYQLRLNHAVHFISFCYEINSILDFCNFSRWSVVWKSTYIIICSVCMVINQSIWMIEVFVLDVE